MSTSRRLISGSAASWAKILIIMVSQVALVPIYLSYWDVKTYGVWLAVQALAAFITIFDYGHQQYMGYEFLRLAQGDKLTISKNLWSAVLAQLFVNVLQFVVTFGFLYFGVLGGLLESDEALGADLMKSAGISFLLHISMYPIATSISGTLSRVLDPFGYMPRFAWWGVLMAIFTNGAPTIAVAFGADLVQASIVLAVTSVVCSIPYYYDLFRLMKRVGIRIVRPNWSLGFRNFSRSVALTGRLVIEYSRQQGVRVVLAPLIGPAGLAAFSTMRTGSNVALQGLNTITYPLMPDLMRFLHNRDQMRSEAAFGTIWIVVTGFLAPAVLIFQTVIEPIFDIWTKGLITFNPTLFAMLSLGVLVYAVAQPAVAVVAGNNLLRPQLILSIIAGLIAIGGIIVLVPVIGIEAAGISLLLAEVTAMFFYTYQAKKWLANNDLEWPARSFTVASLSIVITAVTMAIMIIKPEFQYVACGVGFLALLWNFLRYWKLLPSIVTERILKLVSPSALKEKVSSKFSQFVK